MSAGTPRTPTPLAGGARWYQDAIIYELHVRVFSDSNGDGIGDFRGLVSKLDYLQELGITAIWLLPFYPSPLRDDGYDTADYRQVHPSYGNMRDFRLFLKEAHARGLRVITELVLNHTSDQHAWFQRARRAKPGHPHRDFYVWSDTDRKYQDARIIFKDFEHSNWSWDPVAEAYYWHRFYSHQPDLNWENPEVVKELYSTVDYWFDMGVDGLRLDAVPYLFEREGTNCENLPETHAALRDLRSHVDANHDDKMLLAEANQWPEESIEYFGGMQSGVSDECQMAFHFPLMPRMFMAIRMEDRFPIIDILHETPDIPDGAQWATFLRNHDELTLEMVTDEERDYMWRIYAEDPRARINLGIRRRLAPLLGNNRRLIEMMNGLLFSLPGTPVLYYGDEIGMGDNIYLGDRNGVRTPMQWSADRNAGFSDANPQKLYLPIIIDPEYHAAAINVEAQWANSESLLWWMKRLIAMRKRHPALGHGALEFLPSDNRKVLTYTRSTGDETILCVANLSRYSQFVELDLSSFEGATPVALLGHVEFPPIGELPYMLTLGPHDFYWFALRPRAVEEEPAHALRGTQVPTLKVDKGWHELVAGKRSRLEGVLPEYLVGRRWFRSKTQKIRQTSIVDVVTVGGRKGASDAAGYIVFVEVDYADGDSETYLLPVAAEELDPRPEHADAIPPSAIARVKVKDGSEYVLFDGTTDSRFSDVLLDTVLKRRKLAGDVGRVASATTGALRRVRAQGDSVEPSAMSVEQTNSSIVYGNTFVLKLFRKFEDGVNPYVEAGEFISDRTSFTGSPAFVGALSYEGNNGTEGTVAVLQEFVPNEGDAWSFTLDALGRYYEETLARTDMPTLPGPSPLDYVDLEPPELAHDTIGSYLESARMLGKQTAEMHIALASDPDSEDFAPEPMTALYRRSLYQSMRTSARRSFTFLRRNAKRLDLDESVLELEDAALERFRGVLDVELGSARIRCHGDYHLGQVLWTGRDFRIIDYEGEPDRAIGDRRIKRSPLRDVAGMLRSFHYAAYTALQQSLEVGEATRHAGRMESWALYWYRWVAATFLCSYLETATSGDFLPERPEDLATMLDAQLLEKTMYELTYEANNRPDWVHVPAEGLRQLLEGSK